MKAISSRRKVSIFLWAVFCFSFLSVFAQKARADVKCGLDFTLKSWSVFYKSGKGTGTLSCDNGQRAKVKIRTQGGGITFGKSTIKGHGDFSPVGSMKELYGSYSEAEGHAGVVKSASGHTLGKDGISMNLTGSGTGVDIGFNFGSFKIKHWNE
ncbi:MAG: hypothetical protein U1F57_03910 [bacterium]